MLQIKTNGNSMNQGCLSNCVCLTKPWQGIFFTGYESPTLKTARPGHLQSEFVQYDLKAQHLPEVEQKKAKLGRIKGFTSVLNNSLLDMQISNQLLWKLQGPGSKPCTMRMRVYFFDLLQGCRSRGRRDREGREINSLLLT